MALRQLLQPIGHNVMVDHLTMTDILACFLNCLRIGIHLLFGRMGGKHRHGDDYDSVHTAAQPTILSRSGRPAPKPAERSGSNIL